MLCRPWMVALCIENLNGGSQYFYTAGGRGGDTFGWTGYYFFRVLLLRYFLNVYNTAFGKLANQNRHVVGWRIVYVTGAVGSGWEPRGKKGGSTSMHVDAPFPSLDGVDSSQRGRGGAELSRNVCAHFSRLFEANSWGVRDGRRASCLGCDIDIQCAGPKALAV